MHGKSLMVAVICVFVVGFAGVIAWRFAFFFAPYGWTREPSRLQDVLRIGAGSHIADIGAGDGALAVEMAHVVGRTGVVYATELSADRRDDIARKAAQAGTPQLRVMTAAADATNLPDECCDAIYMRAVFHHIQDRRAFARAVAKAVRPGGRVAVIDFPPGALWFHGRDHGVTAEAAVVAFQEAGLSVVERTDDWGGAMFLVVFERAMRDRHAARGDQ